MAMISCNPFNHKDSFSLHIVHRQTVTSNVENQRNRALTSLCNKAKNVQVLQIQPAPGHQQGSVARSDEANSRAG